MSQQNKQQERYLDMWITVSLVVLAAILYIPFIGSYALWDPWEAHYSQVAMEMVQKNSWWEPWYRNSNRSFWSKPIFTFWLMLSSLKTFRIAQVGDFVHAEFYLRMPIAVIGSMGIGFVYFFVNRLWNRTTGVLAALVLMTAPQYFLIARQVMVDIPFVVVQTMALGFLAMGLFDRTPDDSDEERSHAFRMYLYLAAGFVAAQLFEIVYWSTALKQSWGVAFAQGSVHWLAFAAFFFVWAFVRAKVSDPRTRFFYLFFFFSGLSFLAKGLLSIVLPGGIALFYILLTGDWDLLRRMRLVYVSEKISLRVSIIFGSITTILAAIFIAYPMLKGRGLAGLFRRTSLLTSLDKSIIYPFLKLSISTQIFIFAGIFLGVVALAGFLGATKGQGREYMKACLLPGTLIYVVVAGSWVCVMNFKHGQPFMKEWFIYHHFSRIAGTIEKPNNSFDLYIKQIGFGLFPWAAMIPIALIRFLRWTWKDLTSHTRRRNFFLACWFFFPYFFYTYSSTKFHHYIFPVIPPLAIIVGVWLSRLTREDGVLKERVGLGASLLLFALLAKDLVTNYKPLHQLFTYYTNRQTPGDVFPKNSFTFLFACIFLVLVTIFLSRRLRFTQIGLLMIPICLFTFYVNVRLMPAIGANYSFKAVYTAYKKVDGNKKTPFGEYSNWDERSTSFYSKNFSTYLGRQQKARNFIRNHEHVYIMVSKRKIPMLRRLASGVGKKIYIIARPHYDMWLVSTKLFKRKRNPEDSIVLKAKPNMKTPNWRRVNINFGNKIKMVGVWIDKPKGYKRGDKVKIRFLLKVIGKLKRNWGVFIHADPVKWTRHRQNWDHEVAEGLYPTSEWKVGEYVQDIIVRTIPRNFPAHYSRLHIYTGYWKGADRLPVISANVYNDGQNRARPIVLKILP